MYTLHICLCSVYMCVRGGSFSSSISWPATTENGMASPGESKYPDTEGRLANEHVLARNNFKPLMKTIPIAEGAKH